MHVSSLMQKRYSVTVGFTLAIARTGECTVGTPNRVKVGYPAFRCVLTKPQQDFYY